MPPQLTSVLTFNVNTKTPASLWLASHMGGAASFKPFNVTSPFFLIIILILIDPWIVAEPNDDTIETPPPPPPNDGNPPPPPTPYVPGDSGHKSEPFKPSTAIVVGVLTTMFSLTFLLLLYIKHCNGGNMDSGGNIPGNPNSRGGQPSAGRKNSGIDRAVVESLPIFRFGSLRGQKDGLDCAVCLTRFEAPEVLRLLPKCKHAFHVECVDTWLDAHSTCPLCRYRVDPEDIILVEDAKVLRQNQPIPPPPPQPQNNNEEELFDIERGRNNAPQPPELRNSNLGFRRVSGRHSSVGERDGGFLQIILQTANEHEHEQEQNPVTSSTLRRSLDSARATATTTTPTSRKKSETVSVSVGVGCFVRPRKDGMLLTQDSDIDIDRDRTSAEHRLEHRIIVSPSPKPRSGLHQQRWSDVQPSDLLYLTSEMIISESSAPRRRHQLPLQWNTRGERRTVQERNGDVMNLRSVSEITGVSRFMSDYNRNRGRGQGRDQEEQEQREEGVISRWLAWISKSQPLGDVR